MRWGNVPPSNRSECGLVCLFLILRRHGFDKPLQELRLEYPVGRDGVSSKTLRHALLDFGLPTVQHNGTIEDCRKALRLPRNNAIGYLDGDHFVLFEQIYEDGSAIITDPSEGSVKLDAEELEDRWSGLWWNLPAPGIWTFASRWKISINRFRRSPTLRLAGSCLATNKSLVMSIFVASLVVLVLSAWVPVVTRELINSLSNPLDEVDSWALGAGFIIAAFTYGVFFFLRNIFEAMLQRRVSKALKTEGFSHLLSATYDSVQRTSPGELIYSLNAASLVATGLATLTTSIVFHGLLICMLLIGVSFVWPGAALAMFFCIFLLIPLFAFLSKKIALESGQGVSAEAKGTSEQLQAILSFAFLKITAAKPYVMRRWQHFNERGLHYSFRAQRWQGLLGTISALLTIISPLIPLVWAASIAHSFDLGAVIAAGGVGSIIVSSITQIFTSSAGLAQLAPSVERFDEVMWMPTDKVGNQTLGCSDDKLSIELDGLVVGYDRSSPPVLKEVSFYVPAGGMAVLKGPSGAGKSTLIRCMAGLSKPLDGDLRIQDVSIWDISESSRANIIGFVPQETYLLSGTIREAILVGRKYNDCDIWDVLELVCMKDEIKEMPLGLSTPVGEMGLALSGGQRQRIALARALLGKPKILLLDEATSAVDVPTERSIISNLINHRFTIVAAAHRPAMIEKANIVVTISNHHAEIVRTKEQT